MELRLTNQGSGFWMWMRWSLFSDHVCVTAPIATAYPVSDAVINNVNADISFFNYC